VSVKSKQPHDLEDEEDENEDENEKRRQVILPAGLRRTITAKKCAAFDKIGKAKPHLTNETSPVKCGHDVHGKMAGLVETLTLVTTMKRLLTLSVAILAVAALSARAEDAKALYEKDCSKCHGPDGKGQTKMGQKVGCKDYTDAKVQDALKDEAAIKAIKEGVKDKDDKQVMKPAEGLSDADIKGLVAYMRAFKK
jgi:cytochrome c553